VHVYLTARHFDLTDEIRAYVEQRIVEPLRTHTSMKIPRVEIQLVPATERGGQMSCHIHIELKGHRDINISEIAGDVHAAIDLAQERALRALTEQRDKMLTLSRHPRKYSFDKLARILTVGRRPRTA
jgi:ribosomal subunit interface protein